jgi:hypothetical protein
MEFVSLLLAKVTMLAIHTFVMMTHRLAKLALLIQRLERTIAHRNTRRAILMEDAYAQAIYVKTLQ